MNQSRSETKALLGRFPLKMIIIKSNRLLAHTKTLYTHMKLVRFLLFTSLIACIGTLQAQDIHYSLFNMSPLSLNPAHTGAFNGTFRIGGIYRDQWTGVINNASFTTPSVYIDAPIIKGFGDKDWVGIGVAIINDKVGTNELTTNHFLFSAAYHLAMNKKGSSILTLGVQGGSVGRRLGSMNLNFADEYDFTTRAFTLQGANSGNPSNDFWGENDYIDINAGLMLRSEVNKETFLELGVAFNHLNRPNYSLIDTLSSGNNTDDRSKRPALITAHGLLDVQMSDKWSVQPTFLFQTTAGATEFALQGWLGRNLNKDFDLNFGAGYRFGDSAQALFGLDYRDLKVALSYDINVSSLSNVTNSVGGFEIAAYYIVKIFKKPTLKTKIFCPQF